LKWVKKPTETPDKTAAALQDWLPESNWGDINVLLVGFGQTICKPVRPHCWRCKIKHLCPFTPKSKEPTGTNVPNSLAVTPLNSKMRAQPLEESKDSPEVD
jgi:endonuclease-3